MTRPRQPCRFEDIEPWSEYDNGCTPTLEAGFLGIRIAAPEEVLFGPGTRDPLYGGFTRLIVAGVCKLRYDTLGLRDAWNDAIVMVAVDTRAKRVYSGKLGSEDIYYPAESLDPEEEQRQYRGMRDTMVISRWFNPNLAEDLHLPPAAAEYDVYASLGPYRSNVVHVRLVPQEERR